MQNHIAWIAAVLLLPILSAIYLYQVDTFEPAPIPDHELLKLREPVTVFPNVNSHMLNGSQRIGEGQLDAPEDVAYDPKTGLIYTGCADGWVSRVKVSDDDSDGVVEKWVFTGGRPLGLAHGFNGEVIVADTVKVW